MLHRPAALIVLALALVPLEASAQSGDAAAAEALFDQGRTAMEKGEYDTACSKFRESQRLDPAAGTMLNLAQCEEKRDKLATAWELYRGAMDKLPAGDARIAVARERAESLEKRLPKLTVVLAGGDSPGTTVQRDEVKLGSASLGVPLPVDPGKHVVTVTSPGRAKRTFSVELGEGESRTLDVQPGDPEGSSHGPEGAGSSKTLGYVFGGIGIAGVAVGTVTGMMAIGKKSTVDDHCDPNSRICDHTGADAASSGKTLGTITTASLVVGAVGLGAGAYFLFFADSKSGSETGVVADVQATGPSVSLLHRW